MNQMPLHIIPRRAYGARNFVRHAGVRDQFEQIQGYLLQPTFRIVVVEGHKKSGLTHLTIALSQALTEAGMFPRLVEGADFFDWANERSALASHDPGEVVLVDDADLYLKNIAANDSGHFVNIIELLRRQQGAIMFFMHARAADCNCDAHVMSRLNAAQRIVLGHPSEEDLNKLIGQMAAQRGINISKRNIEFLAKRLPREIAYLDEYLERVLQIAQVSGQTFKLPVLSDAIASLKMRAPAQH